MRRWLAPVALAPLPTLLLVAAAVAVAVGGYEHAHLYHQGYSEVATIGTLFLLNAIGSLLTILLLLARRPLLFVVGSLGISFGSIVALVLTRTTGLFGFEESGYDGHAMLTLLAELAAIPLTLGGAIAAGGALLGEGAPLVPGRSTRDGAARVVAAVVVTIVLGGAIVGVGQGGGDSEPPTLAGDGATTTTTTAPSGGTPPPSASESEDTPADDAPAVSGAVADRSRALFSDRCAGCHTLADAESTGRIGPDLDQVVPGRSAAKLREDIVDPDAETTDGFPAGRMPSFDDLGEQQLTELVDYLAEVTRR
ncbi:MAG: cytochrome c [Patulibacter sp.]|nr:cytochrome c [Patulibacter sp.]